MHFYASSQPWKVLLVTTALIITPTLAHAAGTPADTQITNTAGASYSNTTGTAMPAVTSPAAVVTVSPAPGIQAKPGSQKGNIPAGQLLYFPASVQNTGNAVDTLVLSATSSRGWLIQFIRDDNGNGFHEPTEGTPVTSTGSLAPDAEYKFLIAVSVPAGTTGSADTITLRATSSIDSRISATATVTATPTVAGRPMSPAWTCSIGSPVRSSATVANGIAYIGADDGHLYAIRATGLGAGNILWKYPAGASGVGAPIRGRPAYYDGVIYFGANNGCVYAVNPDGTQRWVSRVSPEGSEIPGAPAVINGTVYVGSGERRIYALRTDTGIILGRSGLLDAPPTTSPAIPMGNFVWFGCQDGCVTCLSPDLSTTRWLEPLGNAPIESSPSVDALSSIMVVGSPDGNVRGLNPATGTTAWGPVNTGGSVLSAAWTELSNGLSYITCGDNKVYAFRTTDGAAAAGYPFAPVGVGGLKSSPVVLARSGGAPVLYAGGSDARFLAIPVLNPESYAVFDAIAAGEPAGEFCSSAGASGLGTADVVVAGCTNGKVYAFPLQ